MTISGITVQQYNGKKNLNATKRGKAGIKYIAIHYVAGSTSASKARYVGDYFSSGQTVGSADFIVDDDEIVQYNPTPETKYCNAVGGNASQYQKTTSLSKTLLGKCTNANSISIEICNMKKADGTVYFTEKAMANAAALCKYLMSVYNIPADRVVMHHMVTGKECPYMWTHKEAWLQGWYDWKKRLASGTATAASTTTTSTASTQKNTPFTANKRDTSKSGSYKTTANLNMRYGPSADYGVVLTLKSGTTVRNYGYYSGEWLFVAVDGKQGWVNSAYLKKS